MDIIVKSLREEERKTVVPLAETPSKSNMPSNPPISMVFRSL